MGFKRCPGSVAFTKPKIELVRCPNCGTDVEVWSDEAEGKCPGCSRPVCRTHTQSCIDWCKYAPECLGDTEFKRYQDLKTRLRKDALLKAAQDHLPDEPARSAAAAGVRFAEQILSREKDADPNVVMAALALYSVPESAPKAGEGGPPGAAGILQAMGYPQGFINEVSGILRGTVGTGGMSVNARIVHDARLLAGGPASASGSGPEDIFQKFMTESGRAVARQEWPPPPRAGSA